MDTDESRPAMTTRHHRHGAPLLPPTIAYVALTVLAVVVPPLIAGLRPWTSDAAMLAFFREHPGAAHASAYFTLGAAVPLAVFVAVSTTRLRTLGLDVPGRMIAQVGGSVAAAMLALASVTTLAATRDGVAASAPTLRALDGLTYAAGGPACVVFLGLLVAGLAISALSGGVLPRTLCWAGVVVAVACEAASLAAAWDGASFLVPVGRFASLAWLLAVGVLLPATRRDLRQRRGIVRAADLPA